MRAHDLIALLVSALYVLAVLLIGLRSRPRLTIARAQLPQSWKPWSGRDGR